MNIVQKHIIFDISVTIGARIQRFWDQYTALHQMAAYNMSLSQCLQW